MAEVVVGNNSKQFFTQLSAGTLCGTILGLIGGDFLEYFMKVNNIYIRGIDDFGEFAGVFLGCLLGIGIAIFLKAGRDSSKAGLLILLTVLLAILIIPFTHKSVEVGGMFSWIIVVPVFLFFNLIKAALFSFFIMLFVYLFRKIFACF